MSEETVLLHGQYLDMKAQRDALSESLQIWQRYSVPWSLFMFVCGGLAGAGFMKLFGDVILDVPGREG